ncbi:MAG: hypothetical protein GXP29_10540, partial [Planctomycetes bacterium]|nr:hypothetical protein [Planctomycetota bacterium]
MQTIQAKVNPRLLTKANRLFTGTVTGRIIEILQNARRAGATKVFISNRDGVVSVHDNGDGVDDFATLLDMGGSGWDELDASEDPAGVGIFCLAPRRVTIRSRGKVAVIERDGWTGSPVNVSTDPKPRSGTVFEFEDAPWSKGTVEPYAVFSGLDVVVDGEPCAREDFVCKTASHHAALGCRIEVRDAADLNSWHRSFRCVGYQAASVLVNFYGQVVAFYCDGIGERDLHVLVDLTGEATNIRLMLPARTQLIENDAMAQLKDAIQMEAYRYILRRGHHTLPYEQYLDAARRGIN